MTSADVSKVSHPQPKLTGWVQAASKNIPKTMKQNVNSTVSTSSDPASVSLEKKTSTAQSNVNSNGKSSPEHRKNKKPTATRKPFNRNEVREYMAQLFAQYSSQKNVLLEDKDIQVMNRGSINISKDSSNWDSVGSKHKNKKYRCLAEVSKALRT